MKKCFKCLEVKPLDQFYKHPRMADGYVNKCKECNKKDVRENYRENIDHYQQYEKLRLHAPHRVKARQGYKNLEAKKRGQISYRIRYPEKFLAHCMVNNAVRDKRLFKQPCEVCGKTKVHAHHDDYYKPMEVRWLCKKHHLEVHGKIDLTDFFVDKAPAL